MSTASVWAVCLSNTGKGESKSDGLEHDMLIYIITGRKNTFQHIILNHKSTNGSSSTDLVGLSINNDFLRLASQLLRNVAGYILLKNEKK